MKMLLWEVKLGRRDPRSCPQLLTHPGASFPHRLGWGFTLTDSPLARKNRQILGNQNGQGTLGGNRKAVQGVPERKKDDCGQEGGGVHLNLRGGTTLGSGWGLVLWEWMLYLGLPLGARVEVGYWPSPLPWGVDICCLWPRAPAKGQRTGEALLPLLFLLSNSTVFLIVIVFKTGTERLNITVVSFHKAVWQNPEDLVSGLSVHTISLGKGILWDRDPNQTPGWFIFLNSISPLPHFLTTVFFPSLRYPLYILSVISLSPLAILVASIWSFFQCLGEFLGERKSHFSCQEGKQCQICRLPWKLEFRPMTGTPAIKISCTDFELGVDTSCT